MKHLLRLFITNSVAVYAASLIIEGFSIKGDFFRTLSVISAALIIVDMLVKPIVNLLLLPINILTLGMFRWIINIGIFYGVTLLISDFAIEAFTFRGVDLGSINVGEIYIGKAGAVIISAILVEVVRGLIKWIME